MKLRLLVPQVKPLPEDRPIACSYCQSPLLQRHQQVSKALIETHVRQTQAVRYRCTVCRRTFRHYAQGASRYRQSQRVMGLAILLWTLGLSQRAVAVMLASLEASIHAWLRPYVERLGVQVLVTDDLNTYKLAVEELGIGHQVCLAHVRKGVTNRLKKVEGWGEEKALIQQLVRELPQNGGALLLRLERRVQRSPPLRRLVVDLLQRWPALVCHQRVAGVPATNNRTEQAIGKSKVRFKTVRGFKSPLGVMAGVALTQWLYSGAGEHDLAELAA